MKIIAEIGSNIKSYQDAEYSICKAREAGANYVKFQCLSEKDLYGVGSDVYTPFNPDWLENLKSLADKTEIEFMCTGFSPEIYERINPFVNVHKIASAEITAIDILEKVASFKKPVILSTGGADLEQINLALQILKPCPVTILYCIPKYPAKIINLKWIAGLKELFGDNYSYGYSDHSIDVCIIPTFAAVMGATVIEKHVNFLEYSDTPDSFHALNFKEFNIMCRLLRDQVITDEEMADYNSHEMRTKWQRKQSPISGKYYRPKP